jgi:superfamily I DNA/RNA helicase
LVTFNRALVTYLKHFHDPSFKNVTVENYHLFARGYLNSRGRMGYNTICQPLLRAKLIDAAVSNAAGSNAHHAVFARGNEFFSGEIQWIEQHGIASLHQYLQAERIGRDGVPLDKKSRQVAHEVFEDYLVRRKAAHKDFDWDDMATAVCVEMDADGSSRHYRHVVIDEGQDFSPQMIRSLSKAIPQEGSLTFFGDMAQQIYGRRMSWKSAGLSVSKIWEFKENYRNTKQVAALGLAISRMPYFKETPDLVEPIAPKADGPLPALVSCSSLHREMALVHDQAIEAAKTQTVAVLARNWELANEVAKHLPRSSVKLDHDLSTWQSGPKIYYGTFHGAKGLEFDTVILPFFSKTALPEPEQVRAFGEKEAEVLDGKLVYVGITRAKTRLIMTFSGSVTELLPTEAGLYQTSSA